MYNRSAPNPRRSGTWVLVALLLLATTSIVASSVLRGGKEDAEERNNKLELSPKSFTHEIEKLAEEDTSLLDDESPRMVVQGGAFQQKTAIIQGQDSRPARQEQAGRRLNDACVEEQAQVDYFDIEIIITGDGEPTNCNAADTSMLGNDINLVIHNHGVDVANQFENVAFVGGVCSIPTTSLTILPGEFVFVGGGSAGGGYFNDKGIRFVYGGDGGCKNYCPPDNSDRRQLATQWFYDTFKPHLEQAMADKIRTDIVPNFEGCVGVNPTIKVEVQGKELPDSQCSDQYIDELELLKTYSLADILVSSTPSKCGQCSKADWSTNAFNGKSFNGGEYVKWHFYDSHGVVVKAFPKRGDGYAPNDKPRIFNTGASALADLDLGSPNRKCPGSAGLGKGSGGEPGKEGENCVPVGNVLIIQNGDKPEPDDYPHGGIIEFTFKDPVFFADIGMMDIDGTDQRLVFTYANGSMQTFAYKGLGDNSVQRVMANKPNVKKLEVILPSSGGVTEINFCPMCV